MKMSQTQKKRNNNFFSTLKKNDEWMTPKIYWQWLSKYINKNLVVWEPFYGTGCSTIDLKQLGFTVVSNKHADFFKQKPHSNIDIVITNPPYSIKGKVIDRLLFLKIPLYHGRRTIWHWVWRIKIYKKNPE